jgi:hypothetical protein
MDMSKADSNLCESGIDVHKNHSQISVLKSYDISCFNNFGKGDCILKISSSQCASFVNQVNIVILYDIALPSHYPNLSVPGSGL